MFLILFSYSGSLQSVSAITLDWLHRMNETPTILRNEYSRQQISSAKIRGIRFLDPILFLLWSYTHACVWVAFSKSVFSTYAHFNDKNDSGKDIITMSALNKKTFVSIKTDFFKFWWMRRLNLICRKKSLRGSLNTFSYRFRKYISSIINWSRHVSHVKETSVKLPQQTTFLSCEINEY